MLCRQHRSLLDSCLDCRAGADAVCVACEACGRLAIIKTANDSSTCERCGFVTLLDQTRELQRCHGISRPTPQPLATMIASMHCSTAALCYSSCVAELQRLGATCLARALSSIHPAPTAADIDAHESAHVGATERVIVPYRTVRALSYSKIQPLGRRHILI